MAPRKLTSFVSSAYYGGEMKGVFLLVFRSGPEEEKWRKKANDFIERQCIGDGHRFFEDEAVGFRFFGRNGRDHRFILDYRHDREPIRLSIDFDAPISF